MNNRFDFLVIISADAEWQAVRKYLVDVDAFRSPYGEWFFHQFSTETEINTPVVFFQGGWGKVAAAGSTQYSIDTWRPKLIVNLGTCGGFEGLVNIGDIVLADRTIIYDIYEQMGDPDEHIRHYSTEINHSWLTEPYPQDVVRTPLVSADRDLFCDEIRNLHRKYHAVAGDWESGAIAWIAQKNQTPCLILRGVTDLVSEKSGEAYNGNISWFHQNTENVMKLLIEKLPGWLEAFIRGYRN